MEARRSPCDQSSSHTVGSGKFRLRAACTSLGPSRALAVASTHAASATRASGDGFPGAWKDAVGQHRGAIQGAAHGRTTARRVHCVTDQHRHRSRRRPDCAATRRQRTNSSRRTACLSDASGGGAVVHLAVERRPAESGAPEDGADPENAFWSVGLHWHHLAPRATRLGGSAIPRDVVDHRGARRPYGVIVRISRTAVTSASPSKGLARRRQDR